MAQSPQLLEIDGVDEIIKKLGQGASSSVYLGLKDGKEVAIKTYQNPRTARAEALYLRRINHPGVPKALFITKTRADQPALVMNYFESIDLSEYRGRHTPDSRFVLSVAIQLTEILELVHSYGFVHRDVKPRNILVSKESEDHPEQSKVMLIDFGLATGASGQHVRTEPWFVGTLLYCSPEQTGTLNRLVDCRSDLYSLGVVLYELIAGHPPFQSREASELIQQHVSTPPPDLLLSNPKANQDLCSIIGKLLSKDPDDRYQTATDLGRDLKKLVSTASQSSPFRMLLDQNTTGFLKPILSQMRRTALRPDIQRKMELKSLADLFRKEAEGTFQWVLIRGEAGSGKTRLIQNLLTLLQEKSETQFQPWIVLKATPAPTAGSDGNISFAIFKQFIAQLVSGIRTFEKTNPTFHKHLSEIVHEASHEIASVLSSLSPHLGVFLKNTMGISHVSLNDHYSLEQIQEALFSFFQRIGEKHPKALLLIEGLEWSDESSLKLLRLFHDRNSGPKFKAITSTRRKKEEFLSSPPSSPKFISLELNPLDLKGVTELVALILGSDGNEASIPTKLFPFLIERAQRNPFLISELLASMVLDGSLELDSTGWSWNEERTKTLPLPSSALDLILSRAKTLRAETKDLLVTCSTIGPTFSLETLSALTQTSLLALQSQLTEAIGAHVIQSGTQESAQSFSFIHLQVVDYFQSLISDYDRNTLQRAIVEHLSNQTVDHAEHWIQLAHHANAIQGDQDLHRLFQINLKAGMAYHSAGNSKEAWDCTKRAIGIHSQLGSPPLPADVYEFFGKLSLTYDTISNGKAFLSVALQNAKENPEQNIQAISRVLSLICEAEATETEGNTILEEIQTIVEGITGIRVPTFQPGFYPALFLITRAAFWLRLPFFISKLRFFLSPIALERCELILTISSPFHTILMVKTAWELSFGVFLRLLSFESIEPKTSNQKREWIRHYQWSSYILGNLGLSAPAQHYQKKFQSLIEEEQDPCFKAGIRFGNCYILSTLGRSNQSALEFQNCIRKDLKWLPDMILLFTSLHEVFANLIWNGHTTRLLQLSKELAHYTNLHLITGENQAVQTVGGNLNLARSQFHFVGQLFSGDLREVVEFKTKADEFFKDKEDWLGLFWIYSGSMAYFLLEQEESEQKIDQHLDRFHKSADITRGSYDSILILVAELYLRYRQWEQANSKNRALRFRQLTEAIQVSSSIVHRKPLLGHVQIIRAKIAIHRSQFFRARVFLKRASEIATELDAPWIKFETEICLAVIAQKSKKPATVTAHVRAALGICRLEGWREREKRLVREYELYLGILSGLHKTNLESSTEGSHHTSTSASHSQSASLSSQSVSFSLSSTTLGQSSTDSFSHTTTNLKLRRNMKGMISILKSSEHFLDLRTLLTTTLKNLAPLIGAERFILFKNFPLEPEIAISANGTSVESPQAYSRNILTQVSEKQEGIFFDGSRNSGSIDFSESIVSHDIRSVLAAPVRTKGKVSHVLYCDSTIARGVFSNEDLELLSAVANYIAFLISSSENATLEIEKIALNKEVEANQKIKIAYNALDQATRNIRAIFDSIQQGICTLDPELKIVGETSRFLCQVTEREQLKNISFPEVVLGNSSLSKNQLGIIDSTLKTAFGESPDFSFDINKINLPRELLYTSPSGKTLNLEIDWIPLLDYSGNIQLIMCTLRDLTELKRFRESSKENERSLKMIDEVLHLKPEHWSFFEQSKISIEATSEKIGLGQKLHALKGVARTLGLDLTASVIHELESDLALLPDQANLLRQKIHEPLSQFLESYQILIQEKLWPLFSSLQREGPTSTSEWSPFDSLRTELEALVRQTSRALGRKLAKVQFDSSQVEVSKAFKDRFLPVFSLLITNSIDHGFRNNPTDPSIQIDVRPGERHSFQITYQDNGDGLDLEQIAKKVVGVSLSSLTTEKLNSLAESIFSPGNSTKETVSEFSGRGIGMSSIKSIVKESQGEIRIEFRDNATQSPCRFAILITLPSEAGLRLRFKEQLAA